MRRIGAPCTAVRVSLGECVCMCVSVRVFVCVCFYACTFICLSLYVCTQCTHRMYLHDITLPSRQPQPPPGTVALLRPLCQHLVASVSCDISRFASCVMRL